MTSPVAPATPQRPFGRRSVGFVALVCSALLVGWLLVRVFSSSSGGSDDATPTTAAKSPSNAAKTAPSTTTAAKARNNKPTTTLLGDPAMRMQPQRAPAPTNSPLPLEIWGDGCRGRSGVLSIEQIGTAATSTEPDRLVLRRRIDVGPEGTWQTTPLLVGQPPGSYRVIASCERRPVIEGVQDSTSRSDLFTMTDVLELTSPFSVRSLSVSPTIAEEATAASIDVSGNACGPRNGKLGRVVGTLFANADAHTPATTGYRLDFSADANATGVWRIVLSVPSSAAHGSFSVEAACSTADPYVTAGVRFLPASQLRQTVASTKSPVSAATRPRNATAATPIRATPTFTG